MLNVMLSQRKRGHSTLSRHKVFLGNDEKQEQLNPYKRSAFKPDPRSNLDSKIWKVKGQLPYNLTFYIDCNWLVLVQSPPRWKLIRNEPWKDLNREKCYLTALEVNKPAERPS